jgi:hypothetical protein
MELNYRFVINNYWLRMINSTASLYFLTNRRSGLLLLFRLAVNFYLTLLRHRYPILRL